MRIIIMIMGMAVVTYIPRMLPAVLINKIKINKNVDKFLNLIPYTAMASLIFPGVLTIDKSRMDIGIIGAFIAIALSWKKAPIAVTIIAAVVADMTAYIVL